MKPETPLKTLQRWLWPPGERKPYSEAGQFARLYEDTSLPVFRYICGLSGGTREEAEDLTAETFLRAWAARDRFSGSPEAALGWLLRIAHNLVIDAGRRANARPASSDTEIDDLLESGARTEADLVTRQQRATLWRLLARLPEAQREMLVLRYLLDWPVKRIAAHLGQKENSVSVAMRRSLERLQRDWPLAEEERA